MKTFQVVTDVTGLHALECECVRCDAGYRPTELERSAARRALAMRLAAEEKAKREAEGLFKPERPRLQPPRPVRLPTPAELDELRAANARGEFKR